MKMLSHRWIVAAALVAAGCGTGADAGITGVGGSGSARFQVINASATPITLVVDGQVVMQGIAARSVSSAVAIDAGNRAVELRSGAGATLAQLNVAALSGKVVTLASTPQASTGGVSASVVTDTGATVAAGFGKLRVLHLAASAPVLEIWRTQPDYQTPISFAFPFTYGNNSGFDQSTPGAWDVRVWLATSEANASHWTHPDAQLTVDVPSGVVKTVAVLDAASGTGYQIQIVP